MFFDTPVYFVFLAMVVIAYWRLPFRAQNVMLLLASYFFYGWWDWRFLGLMLISTVVDHFIAHRIAASQRPASRRSLLFLSLVLNFGFLGFFKYFNFFSDSFVTLLQSVGVSASNAHFLKILLPPGISFYTFQAVAYIVDVYFKKIEPADSIVDYALFISLFPHLIAGPIQRPGHLLPQVQRPRTFDPANFFDGVLLIISGLFRKCVVADNCALIANAAFDGRLGPQGLATGLLGTYAFAWQIYGDFSGYSDMARGSAQLMGFHFMVNFRQPYLATSIRDFWRRWHISLSTWLRDYLYIPLGGSRHGEGRTYRNLFVTMLLGGLWHGANWTFVLWGAVHGGWLALERLVQSLRGLSPDDSAEQAGNPLSVWFKRIFIFHLVCLTWVFFRAESISEAFRFLAGMRHLGWDPAYGTAFVLLSIFTVPLFLIDLMQNASREEYVFQFRAPVLRIATAIVFLVLVALFAAPETNAFIYFQF